MGRVIAKKIKGMNWRAKAGLVMIFTLLLSTFMYEGWLKPLIIDSATNTYYFKTDSTAQSLGADGSTNTSATLNGKISMATGTYNTSSTVTASANTNWQTLMSVYGPAYGSAQTLSAPLVTIGTRDANGTSNAIYWRADVYDYNPSGSAGNGVLLWSSTGTDESHPNTPAAKSLTFSSPAAKNIGVNHRLKVVISCRMTSTNSSARFYWGSSTNYSFMSVTEAATAANTVTVTNLADYNGGGLASVLQGEQNVAMLKFDLYANATTNWTGGKLDKIGNNTNLGDVTFSIYRDNNGNGLFDAGSDTLIGGPYTFSQATGSGYTLTTPQALSTTPQKYFVIYNIAANATTATTVGARITDNTYFTVTNSLSVAGVTTTSSSLPVINGTGAAVSKTYAADWDSGTVLVTPETGGPTVTNSVCVTSSVTEPVGTSLVGLLNFPAHSCASVSGRYHTSSEANAKFVTLYFNGPSGYSTDMTQVKGVSFRFRARASSYSPAPVFTVTLFYVKPDGTRVNAPISSTYSPTTATTYTLSLAGQTFTNVPAGSRLGVQIGVSKSGCSIGLGSAVGAQLVVEDTAAANNDVNVGDGATIASSNVLASSADNVIDSFTLTSPSGNQTVTSVTITGNATTNSSNVALVKLYADNGAIGTLDASDTLLGTATFTGNSATISGLAESVGATYKNYLVVYDIAATPTINAQVTGLVTALGGAVMGVNADSTSATLTILPTTTITSGTSEPANLVVPSGGASVNLDAFGLNINGGSNDTINSVTASLAPAGISAKIAMVEIVDRNSGTVYGQLTAPTIGDDWRISTSGLAATTATTQCYVRITPKANITATYTVTGLVTAVTHLQASNGVVINDTSSATVTLDGQAPTDPVLTATSGTNGGEIQLNWTSATDFSGLSSTKAYTLVRGAANAPAPSDCSSGTLVYQGSALSKLETGLTAGQNYAYRVCATDVVNNTSPGTTATAVATVPTVCSNAPSVAINPTTQFVKAGGQIQFAVSVTNNDTGACGNTTFNLSIVGTENSTDFTTPSTFAPTSLSLGPNGGGANTILYVASKTGAPQGATDAFTVRVSAAGHPSVDSSKTISAIVNNYGPMLHSSMQLGTAKFGVWGTDYSCTTCHVKGSTPNIKKVGALITTPLGGRPVAFSTLSTSATVTSGVLGNDRRVGTTSQNICEVCHHQTRFHQYSASKVAWQEHNNSSDCMKCHPHSKGFKYSAGAQCDDCHGDPPTSFATMTDPATNALGLSAPNAGAHAAHKPLMGCNTCHNNYTLNPMGNSLIEMGFSINNSNYPGFTGSVNGGTFTGTNTLNTFYRWTTSAGTILQKAPNTTSCSVYCHGWPGSGGSNNSPSWVGASQAACGTCHNASGANPPASGSHPKHAGTGVGSNGIACSKCHSSYANYTTSAHINGRVEWNLSQVSASAAYKGSNNGSTGANAPTNPLNYGSCSNLYCHSNVQGANGVGGPTSYSTPTWGGSTVCGSCHLNMYSDPSATGGHVQHAQNPDTNFDCRICHGSGGDANPQNHANGTIDMSFSGYGANTVYSKGSHAPGTAYGSCSNSDCHGRRTIGWGPSNTSIPNLCDKCHGSDTTAAFYSTSGPGSTTSKTDPYVGAHDQHIKAAPYGYATASDCSECHIKPAGPYSPGHIDTPLPAEVTMGTLANRGSFYGYTTLPVYNGATRQCSNTWCHGAGMDSNRGTGAYANVVADGGTLGTPVTPTWNVPMLNGTPSNDCTRCHSYPPPAPNTSYTHYGKQPTDCNGCHNNVKTDGSGFINPALHVNGTIDGGCVSCHASPPIDTAGLVKPAINAMSPGNSGGHNAHQLNPNIGNNCSVCHNNYTRQMPSNTLEIGFNGFNGKVVSGTFYGYSTLTGNVYVSTSAGTVVRRTNNTAMQNTCANVYCHGGGTATLAAIGGGSNTAPDWELGFAEVACGSCHGVSTTSAPTAGSHSKHALSTGLGLTCDTCHGVKTNNYHVNGSVEWHLNLSDPRIGALATYNNLSSGATGNLAPSATFASCNNLYCHSNAQGTGGVGAPSSYTNQQWGAAGPLACGACHKDMATDAVGTGSHLRHAKTLGLACSTCHNGAGSGTTLHANKTIDMAFSGAAAGTVYSAGSHTAGSGPYGTCSTSYCHSNGQATPTYATVTWGGGTLPTDCSACHGTATSDTLSGKHRQHLNPATNATLGLGNGFGCVACHAKTVSNNTTISNSANHDNKFIDYSGVKAGGSSKYSTTTKSCTNIYCHSNGNPGALVYVSMTGSKTWTGTASLGCNSCHGRSSTVGAPDYANGGPAPSTTANSHVKHVAGAADTTVCTTCHFKTASATVASRFKDYTAASYHLNGTPNVYFNTTKAGTTATWTQSSGVCSNVTCHGGTGSTATWGATLNCQDCHGNGTSADVENFTGTFWNNGIVGKVRMTGEWDTTGHGKASGTYTSGNPAANFAAETKQCEFCHDSTVGHYLSSNPFRLRNYSTAAWGRNAVCQNCHATGSLGVTVGTTTKNGTKKVGSDHMGAKHGASNNGGQFCWDCHDGHGDTNVYMVHSAVAKTSDRTTSAPVTSVATTFTAFATGTDYAQSVSPFTGICNVCHATTSHYTATSGDGHNSGSRCTSCHSHTGSTASNAFAGAGGESSGGAACNGCHSDITSALGSTSGYHHYMNNSNATAGTVASGVLGNNTDTNRNCLMCHVDHNYFRPDLNATNGGRGKNLRTDIATAPAVATATTYANTDFQNSGNGGLCLSCHKNSQTSMGYTQPDGTTSKQAIPYAGAAISVFNGAAHQYTASSTFSGTLTNTFAANCSKCHDDNLNPESSVNAQSSTNKFGVHQSNFVRDILSLLGITAPTSDAKLEEAFCFKCHTGGTAGNDYYGAKAMTATARSTEADFAKTGGRHNVAGYNKVHSATEQNASGLITTKHIECADCHNTHAASNAVHTLGTNAVSGILSGVPGAGATYTGAWTAATYSLKATATAEYEICFKCHNTGNTSWGGTGAASWTDIGLEFNPNNQSYHPVIQALPATGNRRLATTALTGGWTPGMVMFCSDCHAGDSAGGTKGPHGSSVKWMLSPNTSGTKYYNWPYTTAAGNGTSTGTLVMSPGNSTGPTGGVFCLSCHAWSGGGAGHTRGDHSNISCVGCHIRVPHGGKMPRLLTSVNAPARYKPDGNGGGTVYLDGVNRPASGTFSSSNCNGGGGCTTHSGTMTYSW